MADKSLSAQAFRVADLSARRETRFDLRPDAAAMRAIAADLDLASLRKLTFSGLIRPDGAREWRLEAMLGATLTQPCVVTLAPVVTRIDEPVTRRFLAEMPDQTGADEVELPEDETIEELGSHIDPYAVMIEALALAVPLYPRAEGASLGNVAVCAPGVEPLTEEVRRPFAGLATLREKMERDD